MTKPSWIDAMQEEIHDLKDLKVWNKCRFSRIQTRRGSRYHRNHLHRLLNRGHVVLRSNAAHKEYDNSTIWKRHKSFSEWRAQEEVYVSQPEGFVDSYMPEADHRRCQDTERSTSESATVLSDKLVFNSNYRLCTNCDNKSAIALCCNNVQHSRAKHIDIRYHFIKEQVENGILEL
ncbi:hypothetical protein Tco_0529441 [Tanacetum coccineum]